jgi:hypothetical protein
MAVNVSIFTASRIQELEPEFEDQELEDEIDQLARERAASACRKFITHLASSYDGRYFDLQIY